MRKARWRSLAIAGAFMAMLVTSVLSRVPADLESIREHSLDLVNQARRQEELRPLQLGPHLNEAAQSHADDMLSREYYGHESPEGGTVKDRYVAAGGARSFLVAENIARCRHCAVPMNVEAVEHLHGDWMNSPEHRENILAEGLSRYGFGIAEDENGTRYSVQTFAGPGTPRGVDGESTAIGPTEQTELAARLINEERRRNDVETISADQGLIDAAQDVIPAGELTEVSLDELNPLRPALPTGGVWRRVQMIAGSCGGCGVDATDADVQFFLGQWRADARYRDILLDPDLTKIGMTVESDRRGRKIAVAVLAGGGG